LKREVRVCQEAKKGTEGEGQADQEGWGRFGHGAASLLRVCSARHDATDR